MGEEFCDKRLLPEQFIMWNTVFLLDQFSLCSKKYKFVQETVINVFFKTGIRPFFKRHTKVSKSL